MRIGILSTQHTAALLPAWLAFHRQMGVTDFLLFDNSECKALDFFEHEAVQITPVTWDGGTPLQLQTLNSEAAMEWRRKLDWMIHLDGDELLVPTGVDTLTELLGTVPMEWDAVAFNWRMMGEREPGQGILGPMWDIVQCSAVAHPLNLYFKSAARPSTFISEFYSTHHAPVERLRYLHDGQLMRRGEKRCTTDHAGYSLGQVNHYQTRSRAEWDEQRNRLYPAKGYLSTKNTRTYEIVSAGMNECVDTRARDLMTP